MNYNIVIRKKLENVRPLHFSASIECDKRTLKEIGELLATKYPLEQFDHQILSEETIFHQCYYTGALKTA